MALKKSWTYGRNIILYVQTAPLGTIEELRTAFADRGKKYKFVVLIDDKKNVEAREKLAARFDLVIPAKMNSHTSIEKALKPYEDKLLAITCRSEANMGKFRKVIPNVPYLRTPTVESVSWAIDKTQMRRRFTSYDKTITPKYLIVKDNSAITMKKIEKKVGFPLVVKPAGLAQSLLVTICYHEDE